MRELLSIIDSLKNDSSRTGKESILKKHTDNKLFRKVLLFVYNPYIVTGLSSKKINAKVNIQTNIKVNDISEMMDYLKENNTGRHLDVAVVNQFISTLTDNKERELVKEIATKSLKIGATSTSINKVYGKDAIPSFAVQLAEPYSKKSEKIIGEFFVTLKIDGNRCVAIKDDGKVKFFTRKGQVIEHIHELETHFTPLPNGVYDGELLLKNDKNLNSADLFRATQKVIRTDGEKKNLEFWIFDFLPVKEFKEGQSKATYSNRRKRLDELAEKIIDGNSLLHVLPVLYQGSDKSVIGDLMQQVVADGYEGLMINVSSGLYQTKRTVDLQKVKEFHTADLPCVEVVEGEGKNVGKLGRINVVYKGNLVGIGSGFTDEERKLYYENPSLVIGKIIETQFFEETKDEKTGLPSLRFPVFKTIREDKDIEDINID